MEILYWNVRQQKITWLIHLNIRILLDCFTFFIIYLVQIVKMEGIQKVCLYIFFEYRGQLIWKYNLNERGEERLKKKEIFRNTLTVKGVCHEIFDLRFFHDSTPSWPPDKQATVFSNSVSISLRYLIIKLSPHCVAHRGDNFVINYGVKSSKFRDTLPRDKFKTL